MIFVALTLMATGVMGGLLGYKLFKVMLPLIGLIIGSTIGFVGVQSVFGAGDYRVCSDTSGNAIYLPWYITRA